MSEANWFNVFDSDNSEWLTGDGKWSKRYRDAKEFETWGSAVAEAKACDPKGQRTPVVFGDFGNAHDAEAFDETEASRQAAESARLRSVR